jgi:O-antigen chain-terminating methyltransferase
MVALRLVRPFGASERVAANFYRAFEDQYRGSRELIKLRLEVYLPFLAALARVGRERVVLDLGCGRGEWLELLQAHSIKAQGVDLDEGMLMGCRERGFDVIQYDAISHLQAQPSHSVLAVTGFHIAEHLSVDVLQALIQEALRVLMPGGLLILETPNPENLVVGTANFYIDPSHLRPLPAELLVFLAQYQGYSPVKLLRLQEDPGLADVACEKDAQSRGRVSLYDVLGHVSPDYAIVAQAPGASPELQLLLEPLFAQARGASLYGLAIRFDEQWQAVERRAKAANDAAQMAQKQMSEIHALALDAGQRVDQLAAQLRDIYGSTSWRVTRPLRWLKRLISGALR